MCAISILIPAYNAEKYIAFAIESVLSQTFSDWELIIIDDASDDNTYVICERYALNDNRILLFKNQANMGMLANWNYGITLCKHKYFIKLDADDVWHAHILEKSVTILEQHPEVALVFTKYETIDSQGKTIDNEIHLPEFARNRAFSCIPLVKLGVSKMLGFNILRQGLSLIRRDVFDKIGSYRYLLTPTTQASTDTEFYFRVGCHYQIYCIDEVLYYYRIHKMSISNLNAVDDLQAQKMFEVKISINDYYFKQNKISLREWKENKKVAQLYYNSFLVYKAKRSGDFLMFISLITKGIALNPLKSIIFYMGRLKSKLFIDE